MELNYESLRKWFKQEDWVRIDTQGNISGKCGTMKKGKAKTRCLPRKRAQGMSKAERKATVAKKVRGSKKGKQYVKVKENMDKKELKNIILKTLEKEGGAAGIKALAKASKTSKDKLKKSLAKMTGVKQHQDGDYISTPISEEKTIKGVHKGPTPNSQYCECHITENGVTTIQLVYCSAKYCNKDVCCHPDYLGRTKTPTDIDMDMDMMDKGMDDVNVAGGIPHFTYPERHSGYLEGIREVKDIIEVMLDEKKKKKKDRCHRKADSVYGTKTSAYKSGAIVKCRKGMIWKKKANEEVEDLKIPKRKSGYMGYSEPVKEEELKNPKKADLNKDGKLSSYEKTRGKAIEKAIGLEENMSIQEVLDMEIIDENITEAKYKGKTVKLNKPMRGDVKKFKVYVNSGKKNADGSIKVKKVNFGHGGTSAKRPTMRIRKSNAKRRKAFRARHRCDNPGPKTMARYWSCKAW